MTTIPPLPDLGPDYPETIDELIAEHDLNANEMNFSAWERSCAQIDSRRTVRDAILYLQDELNAAGLVIVPEADWNAGQAAIERNAYLQALVDLGDDEG